MEWPGSLTFSFLRGERLEERYQKVARRGKNRSIKSKAVIIHPPLMVQEIRHGTVARRVTRPRLEKWSPEGPSAGSGPVLIEGDCHQY